MILGTFLCYVLFGVFNIFKFLEVPGWWSNASESFQKKTRSGILMQRKTDKIPDSSYDLDGDGIVGGRDLVIAKQFDIEKKGSLTIE